MEQTPVIAHHGNGKPELLAPAGNVESFHAALDNGADAVYLGLKQWSARAAAANFSLEELALLLPYAHTRQAAVYVALNAIVTAGEFPGILDTLAALADLRVDAVIVQDPGVLFLVRRHFPGLALHASTLMTLHNSAGVNQLGALGAQRAVLARELTLEEIGHIAAATTLDLEVFVHGALCFSYSGLCLASSFRGGHGSLQGRCVQPCRLRYRQGRKEGFFLSCNDLCALPVLPALKRLRLAAWKIEGRMKTADIIGQVVKAYRLVLDAGSDEEQEAVQQARAWLQDVPSRRLSLGFLGDNPSAQVLSPHRSGSSGAWVGTVQGHREGCLTVTVRGMISPGDRLRPESKAGREESAFTVKELRTLQGVPLAAVGRGQEVRIPLAGALVKGERLFKVGSKGGTSRPNADALWRAVRRQCAPALTFSPRFAGRERLYENWPHLPPHAGPRGESLAVKVGTVQDLLAAMASPARHVLLTATRANLERLVHRRLPAPQRRRFGWSLPAILMERELDYYRRAVAWYTARGFHLWELNNWGHFRLFRDDEQVEWIAGCRFNLRNAAALAAIAQAGCRQAVLSVEITFDELQQLMRVPTSLIPMVQVYGWPPLFTSRLTLGPAGARPLLSARGETLWCVPEANGTRIHADRPVNWCGRLDALRAAGYRHFLVDVSEGPPHLMPSLDQVLADWRAKRATEPYALFNYARAPVRIKGRKESP
jgi:putative protease